MAAFALDNSHVDWPTHRQMNNLHITSPPGSLFRNEQVRLIVSFQFYLVLSENFEKLWFLVVLSRYLWEKMSTAVYTDNQGLLEEILSIFLKSAYGKLKSWELKIFWNFREYKHR